LLSRVSGHNSGPHALAHTVVDRELLGEENAETDYSKDQKQEHREHQGQLHGGSAVIASPLGPEASHHGPPCGRTSPVRSIKI
jgi:hypothetical protein